MTQAHTANINGENVHGNINTYPKNKPFRKPMKPPRKQGIKKPATMGGTGRTVARVDQGKRKAPGKIRGLVSVAIFKDFRQNHDRENQDQKQRHGYTPP